MTEDLHKDTAGHTQPPSKSDLWNQLGNAVILVAKQDQIVWAVFGVFWAANAVLLVALITSGDLPKWPVGLIVSFVGIAFSLVWLPIERRALAWLEYYEAILTKLEKKYLHVPLCVAFTGYPETVGGMSVRPIMRACPYVSAVLWGCFALWFLTQSCRLG